MKHYEVCAVNPEKSGEKEALCIREDMLQHLFAIYLRGEFQARWFSIHGKIVVQMLYRVVTGGGRVFVRRQLLRV
jgi:hypothetical protein